jgi:hypothetical protein
MNIYCLYDRQGRYLRRLDLYPNDLVAFRDYDLYLSEQHKRTQGVIKSDDYSILCLGSIDNTSDLPTIRGFIYEVKAEDVLSKLKENPLFSSLKE